MSAIFLLDVILLAKNWVSGYLSVLLFITDAPFLLAMVIYFVSKPQS